MVRRFFRMAVSYKFVLLGAMAELDPASSPELRSVAQEMRNLGNALVVWIDEHLENEEIYEAEPQKNIQTLIPVARKFQDLSGLDLVDNIADLMMLLDPVPN